MQHDSGTDYHYLFNEKKDRLTVKVLIVSNSPDKNSEIENLSMEFFTKENIYTRSDVMNIVNTIAEIMPDIIIIPFNIIPMNLYYIIKNLRSSQVNIQCIAYYTFESIEYEKKMLSIMERSIIFEGFINIRYENLYSILKQLSC